MGLRPSRILARIFALGVGLSGVLGATLLPAPQLFEPYTVTPCGQPGQVPCNITPTGRTPTVADLQGLTNSLFVNFFVARGYGPLMFSAPTPPVFGWTPRVANANGYVIGDVYGTFAEIHTEFIYHAGQVLCCITDTPFYLYGINDQNVVVGEDYYLPNPYDPEDGAFAAPFLAMAADGENHPLFLAFKNPRFDPGTAPGATYLAIDNQDRILLDRGGEQYMLQPTPEPASIVFLATVLIGCGILTRWRILHRPVLSKEATSTQV